MCSIFVIAHLFFVLLLPYFLTLFLFHILLLLLDCMLYIPVIFFLQRKFSMYGILSSYCTCNHFIHWISCTQRVAFHLIRACKIQVTCSYAITRFINHSAINIVMIIACNIYFILLYDRVCSSRSINLRWWRMLWPLFLYIRDRYILRYY